jgi:hypothetical protein
MVEHKHVAMSFGESRHDIEGGTRMLKSVKESVRKMTNHICNL